MNPPPLQRGKDETWSAFAERLYERYVDLLAAEQPEVTLIHWDQLSDDDQTAWIGAIMLTSSRWEDNGNS